MYSPCDKCDLSGNDYEKGNLFKKNVNRFFFAGANFFRMLISTGPFSLEGEGTKGGVRRKVEGIIFLQWKFWA
jgi:hypothetical protein